MVQIFYHYYRNSHKQWFSSLWIHLKKVWWKRDGCPAFEKPPFETKSGQGGGRKRYATCLRHSLSVNGITSKFIALDLFWKKKREIAITEVFKFSMWNILISQKAIILFKFRILLSKRNHGIFCTKLKYLVTVAIWKLVGVFLFSPNPFLYYQQ